MSYVTDANKELTLQLYANPMLLQDKVLTLFENHVFDKKQVLDGNNVFTFGLEMEATMIASIVNEMSGAFESLYPERARTMRDLYRHMSDYDFVGVYATPSSATICLMLDRDWIIANAVSMGDGSGTSLIRIPANSTFTLGDSQFGIYYPINIEVKKKVLDTGEIDLNNTLIRCTWDTSTVNPLYTVSSNIIEHRITITRNTTYLGIVIPVYQFVNTITKSDLISSTGFLQRYDYYDQFYAARVFHWLNNTWNELPITLSDVVYNQDVATAKVKVLTDIAQVEVSIPQVYFSSGMIGNKLMVMVYTTKGNITSDLRGYSQDQFAASLMTNDDLADTTYSEMLRRIPTVFITPISSAISGGRGQCTLASVKSRIVNSAGSAGVLVTAAQLTEYLSELGFECTKYIDNITDRIWLAKRDIKDSLGNTVASALYKTFISHDVIDNTNKYDCIVKMKDADSIMIMPNALFKWDTNTDCMKLLTTEEKIALSNTPVDQRLTELNTSTYMYTPYHVKLDCSYGNALTSPYQLFNPSIDKITFVSSNSQTSTQVSIYNIAVSHLENGTGGYKVSLTLYKTNDLQTVTPAVATPTLTRNITAILRVKNQSDVYCYIEGKYEGKNTSGYDILSFTLDTDYSIDDTGYIGTNSMTLVSSVKTLSANYNKIPLEGEWDILFFVKKDLISESSANSVTVHNVPKAIVDQDMVFVAQQCFTLTLGSSIPSLRTSVYATAASQSYKTHTTTTYATYGTDVYRRWDDEDNSYDDQLLTDDQWLKIQQDTGSNAPTEYQGNAIITDSDGKHYLRISFNVGDVWYNYMTLETEILHHSGDLILSSATKDQSLKTPAMDITTTSVDGKVVEKETLYQDTDTPTSEPEMSVKFVPYYYKYDKSLKTYSKDYTGKSEVYTKDYLGSIIDYVDGKEYDSIDSITRKFTKQGESYAFTDIPDTFVFVKNAASDSSTYPKYKIILESSNIGTSKSYKYKLVSFTTNSSVDDLAADYYSEVTTEGTINRHNVESTEYGCLYSLDIDALSYDRNNALADDDIMSFYSEYDKAGSLTDTIIERYALTTESAEALLKLRFPWKKICYAGHLWCIEEYYNRRSLMNFNSSLLINKYVGLASINHLKGLLGDISKITRFTNVTDAISYLDKLGNTEEYVWVSSYNPNLDTSYGENNLDTNGDFTPLINIGSTSTGALLLNDLNRPKKHFVVVTGSTIEESAAAIQSVNASSGSCWICDVYDDPASDTPTIVNRYYRPINEDIDMEKNSDDDCTNWPWELDNWLPNTGTTGPIGNVHMTLGVDTYAKIVHKKGDVLLTATGRPATADSTGRKIDYTLEMVMYDCKPALQTAETAKTYSTFVRDLVWQYCNIVQSVRSRLLERTTIYYSPIRTFGLGDFKAQNGDTFTHNLEVTVGFKLHVPLSVVRDNATKSIIRNNILTIVKEHLATGNFSMIDVADEIKETMSDNIYYVDITGIDGDPDLQTLVSVNKEVCRPYLKQRLVRDTNNAIVIEDSLDLEYAALI